jgi:hypothetical protein
MAVPLLLRNVYWGLTTVLELIVLVYLVRRRRYLSHPAFFRYIILIIAQSAITATAYSYFGEDTQSAYDIVWTTQGVVICARWLAVIEIARRTLARYTGIWALATRIFLVLSACVLAYSILSSRSRWEHFVLNADRAVELCIAVFVVCMFLFVRYYAVDMDTLERMLAIGFCLYSCFRVINDSIYESWFRAGGNLWTNVWTYLDMLTFLASLLLWIIAVRTAPEETRLEKGPTVKPELYGNLAQKLNARLNLLNDRLNNLFRFEDSYL